MQAVRHRRALLWWRPQLRVLLHPRREEVMRKFFAAIAGIIGVIALAVHNVRVTIRGINGEEADEE